MGTNLRRNAAGHLEPVEDEVFTDTAVVNEAAGIVFGDVLVMEAAGTCKLYDSSVALDCDAICGISDGTYANGATATFYKDGAKMPGFVGQTPGVERWADPTTHQLGDIAAIGVGEFTRLMGRFDSATEFKIAMIDRFTA